MVQNDKKLPLSVFPDPQLEAQSIAKALSYLLRKRVEKPLPICKYFQEFFSPQTKLTAGDIAILYRTSQQLDELEKSLQKYKIPYQLTRSNQIFCYSDTQPLLSLLRFSISPESERRELNRLLQIWPKSFFHGSPQIGSSSVISKISTVRELKLQLEYLKESEQRRDYIECLDKIGDLIEKVKELKLTDSHSIISQVWELLKKNLPPLYLPPENHLAELFVLAKQEPEPRKFLNKLNLEDSASPALPHPAKVSVLPIRAAKALSFPFVIVPGCNEGIIPLREAHNSAEELQEERRIFYFALTRAGNLVWITRYETIPSSDKKSEIKPSRFLKQISEFLVQMS